MLIQNGRVFDSAAGIKGEKLDILTEGVAIKKMAKKIKPKDGETVINARGLYVIPGLVDLHAHLRVPGQEHKETFATGGRSAAKGGFTTVLAMPNTVPPVDNPGLIGKLVEKAAAESVIEVRFVSAMTVERKGQAAVDFAANIAAGAVAFSDDGSAVQDRKLIMEICRKAKESGALLIEHPEVEALSENRPVSYGAVSDKKGIPGQPAEAESLGILTMGMLAGHAGARAHFTHVSTGQSVRAVRFLKKTYPGLITCDCTPHHLILNELDILKKGGLDANKKINPPLRPESDRRAVEKAVLDGTIDCIATDHAPHAAAEKAAGIDRAPFGSVGFETLLCGTFTRLVLERKMPVVRWLRLLTENPAGIAGLERGALTKGGRADIVLFDPEEKWTVRERDLASLSKNSAFIGRTFRGVVLFTICGGKLVYERR